MNAVQPARGQRTTAAEVLRGTARDALLRAMTWRMGRAGDLGGTLLAPRGRAEPYPTYARIRQVGRVVRTDIGLMTAHHDLVGAVLRDPGVVTGTVEREDAAELEQGRLTRFALAVERPEELVQPVGPESMIGMDAPDHTRLRKLVARVFTPKAIQALRPRIGQLADGLLDDVARRDGVHGGFDLMASYARALPVLAICEVLGIPGSDRPRFEAWGEAIAVDLDVIATSRQRRAATAALRDLHGYFEALFAERRTAPGDDLLSRLIAAEEEGERLNARELMSTCLLLLVAGFETTVNLLGNGVLALLHAPEQLRVLRDDPGLMPNAVEELLRFDAPVQITARIPVRDLELAGEVLRARQPLNLLLGGANRDPDVFGDPDTLDVTRDNARQHLAFAAGPHHCLGAALARLEGEIGLTRLLERHPHLALGGEPVRRPTFVLRGLESLPLATQTAAVGVA